MKLLILHMALALGGGERTTRNLLEHLDRRRINTVILAAPAVIKDYFAAAYDEFIDAAHYGLGYGFTDARSLWQDSARCAELIREVKPDLALGIMHYPSALIVLGGRRARTQAALVASYRGPFFEYMRHYEHVRSRRLFLRAAVAGTARLADRVIVPSQGTRQEISRRFLGRNNVVVIPNGIDATAVTQAAQAPVDMPVAATSATPLIVAAARLSPEKNLHLLLAAFRQVRATHNARLLIVGDGPERAALEQTVIAAGLRDAVAFAGYQSNVFPYLKQADMFIHTCLFEGFGYAMLEAMACGTPVIATDCPHGPREILGNNAYGRLVPPGDPAALAQAMIEWLEQPEQRHAFAARGLARAQQLSIGRMVRGYEDVFEELVTRRQKISRSPIV